MRRFAAAVISVAKPQVISPLRGGYIHAYGVGYVFRPKRGKMFRCAAGRGTS